MVIIVPEDWPNLSIQLVTKLKKEVPRIFLSHTPREKAFLYKAILKKTETDYI